MSWEISEESKEEREQLKGCVGPGWSNLLDALFETLDLIEQGDFLKTFHVSQVKEKFGTLRFYIDAGTDAHFGAIDMAEHMSAYICEQCGKPGNLVNMAGWWATRCEEHRPNDQG